MPPGPRLSSAKPSAGRYGLLCPGFSRIGGATCPSFSLTPSSVGIGPDGDSAGVGEATSTSRPTRRQRGRIWDWRRMRRNRGPFRIRISGLWSPSLSSAGCITATTAKPLRRRQPDCTGVDGLVSPSMLSGQESVGSKTDQRSQPTQSPSEYQPRAGRRAFTR